MNSKEPYTGILLFRFKTFSFFDELDKFVLLVFRVEQTQREIAASAASSRAVVRHLETEVDSSHQLHVQISELSSQLETTRKQAAQWKQAAEILSKEKQTFKERYCIHSLHLYDIVQVKN